MPDECIVAYRGEKFTIEWALDHSGTARARDFFNDLPDKDRAKVLTLFERLGNQGKIRSREKFKKIDDDLWEFKSFQVRLLGDFRPGGRFLIALGVRKKKDRHSRKDMEMARAILSLDERSQ